MKSISIVVVALVALVLWNSRAALADVEPVGKVVVAVGAEKEEGMQAGGRGMIEVLGVLPFSQNFGLQSAAHYVGGLGSRFGLTAGPLFSWGSGKAGLFVAYQYRTLHSNNFVHLRPSVAFYLPQANINLFYSHPVSSPQRDNGGTEVGINLLQGSFSYFPAADLASFMRRDNVEFMLGLQVNSFGGVGSDNLTTGVGPVFGFAFMPAQGLEVNVIKAAIDNHGRYRVLTGLSYYFAKGAATLKELRRRYLEPNFFIPNAGGRYNRKHSTGRVIQPPPVPG